MSAQDLMARFGCLNQETSVEMEQYFKDKGVDITEDVLNEIEERCLRVLEVLLI